MNNRIDFLASQPHYLDHLAPVWKALRPVLRGTFYVPETLNEYAQAVLQRDQSLFCYNERTFGPFVDHHPVLVAGYGDMMAAHRQNEHKRILMMEHGTGHSFGTAAYPNGPGKRDWVSMFLPPNQYTLHKIKAVRNTRCEVIGTPKLDRVVRELNPYGYIQNHHELNPIIAVGFHWGSKNNRPPESGTAFDHYKDILPELSNQYRLLGYGHPLADEKYRQFFLEHNIEYASNLWEVFQRAAVCVNDLSSAMYEFLVTGKPVIVLNAPWFRRDVQHGIRFWDYSDIGINVEQSSELVPAIQKTLTNYYNIHIEERQRAIRTLFPYLGNASARAAQVLEEYLE
jgi:hypothetical protein